MNECVGEDADGFCLSIINMLLKQRRRNGRFESEMQRGFAHHKLMLELCLSSLTCS